jgi:hypothetical protein
MIRFSESATYHFEWSRIGIRLFRTRPKTGFLDKNQSQKSLIKNKGYYIVQYSLFFDIKDTIMTFNMYSPFEMGQKIAASAKEKRLSLNLSQSTLASRSGVSLGVIKKFERSSEISLKSLLKIAIILDALNDFRLLFAPRPLEKYNSLDEILNLKRKVRKRGRS